MTTVHQAAAHNDGQPLGTFGTGGFPCNLIPTAPAFSSSASVQSITKLRRGVWRSSRRSKRPTHIPTRSSMTGTESLWVDWDHSERPAGDRNPVDGWVTTRGARSPVRACSSKLALAFDRNLWAGDWNASTIRKIQTDDCTEAAGHHSPSQRARAGSSLTMARLAGRRHQRLSKS
jgi:hypothetical protein